MVDMNILNKLCFKNLSYCCSFKKPCKARTAVLSRLGISNEAYNESKVKMDEDIVNNFKRSLKVCQLCNKNKTQLAFRPHPKPSENKVVVGPMEHRAEFTREEVGVINKIFTHNKKTWNPDKDAYINHAHVYIDVGNRPFIPKEHNKPLPSSMLECKAIPTMGDHAKTFITELKGKKMIEIGSSVLTNPSRFARNWEMEYWCLDLLENPDYKQSYVADIHDCPNVPTGEFDFVYSSDTFEHLKKPWLAAKEMGRITKPGGIVFVTTLFSWRYHPCPIDYWRFTPHALASLFEDDFDLVEANWDITPRRGLNDRGVVGEVGKDEEAPVDEMGGWRENWKVFYVGKRKDK